VAISLFCKWAIESGPVVLVIIRMGAKAFSRGIDAALVDAISTSIGALRSGFHAFVVTPQALQLVRESALPGHIKDQLELVHRNWLESQGLMRIATRVIEITGDPLEDGTIDGDTFFVYSGSTMKFGFHREACHIVEAIEADGKYLNLLMELTLDFDRTELRKFWFSRVDSGGGGNIYKYIDRFISNPSPTYVLCDRDGKLGDPCGPTAQKCIDELITKNIYSDHNSVMIGGFSNAVACFGFRVIAAHEMENLILPRVANVLLTTISDPLKTVKRLGHLQSIFPNFPNLTAGEAEIWLNSDFKATIGDVRVFNSDSLVDIANWASESDDNLETLKSEIRKDLRNPIFLLPIDDIVRDVWTTGACHRSLM